MTGKGYGWGGSLIRPEATGFGQVYFLREMLASKGDSIESKKCAISGSGNVSQYCAKKVLSYGGKVITMSDSGGYIFDKDGIDEDKFVYNINADTAAGFIAGKLKASKLLLLTDVSESCKTILTFPIILPCRLSTSNSMDSPVSVK